MKRHRSVWIEKRKGKTKTTYRVVWRLPDGKKDQEKFTNKPLAIQYLNHKRLEVEGKPLGLAIPSNETVREAVGRYLRDSLTYKSEGTVTHFDKPALTHFVEFCSGITPAQVTDEIVTSWKLVLLEKYSPNTVRMWLRCLRTFMNYCRVPVNPVKTDRMPKEIKVGRVITAAELEQLVNNMPAIPGRAAAFAYHSAVRIGELLNLTYEDLRKTPSGVIARISGKTGEREILLEPEAVKAVGPLEGHGKVFKMGFDQLQWYLQEARRLTKLGRIRWHDFRHTAATNMMRKTGNLFLVQNYGGWRSITSMRVYQHHIKDGVVSLSAPIVPPNSRQSPSTDG